MLIVSGLLLVVGRPARRRLRPQPRAPRGLVPAVEHLGDLIDAFGPRRGIAGRRSQVDVPEPRGDLVDGYRRP